MSIESGNASGNPWVSGVVLIDGEEKKFSSDEFKLIKGKALSLVSIGGCDQETQEGDHNQWNGWAKKFVIEPGKSFKAHVISQEIIMKNNIRYTYADIVVDVF